MTLTLNDVDRRSDGGGDSDDFCFPVFLLSVVKEYLIVLCSFPMSEKVYASSIGEMFKENFTQFQDKNGLQKLQENHMYIKICLLWGFITDRMTHPDFL